jgi:subtilisin-like proprotein convertase family protein
MTLKITGASLLLTILVNSLVIAQSVPMTDGITQNLFCGDPQWEFTDAQGTGVDYAPDQNITMTFCSSGGNSVLFSADATAGETWDIHPSDTLYIFDGADASAPLIGAFNAGTDPDGVVVSSSLDNTSGCLTFVFVSNSTNEGEGWVGNVACQTVWQPYEVNISSTPQAQPNDSGYVDICLGESVTFNAVGNYPYSGAGNGGYSQSNANINFRWVFGDGASFEGIGLDEITYTFDQQAGYNLFLTATDAQGQDAYATTRVRVGTTPVFNGTSVVNDTICLGDTALLSGVATPIEGSFLSGGSFGDQLYLPDGSGVSYQTSITISGFPPGETVTDLTDLDEICLNMEHSYLGDLEMRINCPNGQTVILKQYPGGGGTYLGEANDIGANGNPGTGLDYCFSMSATWGTMLQENTAGNHIIAGNLPNNTMTPGTYTPFQSFANLAGCPINGDWTLTVTDNLSADDGFIFGWSLNFDATLNPTIESYTPTIVETSWSDHPSVVATISETEIQVSPTSTGNQTYVFSVTDDFGCSYDTTVTLHVRPINITVSGNEEVCIQNQSELAATGAAAGGEWGFTGPQDGVAVFSPGNTSTDVSVGVDLAGTYTFIFTEALCGTSTDLDVTFAPAPVVTILADTNSICVEQELTLRFESNTDLFDTFNWSPFQSDADSLVLPGTDSTAFSAMDSTFIVTLTASNFCGETEDVFVYRVIDCELFIPTVFNPNAIYQDNTFFNVNALDLHPGNNMKIFDRWGRKCLDRDNYHLEPWDGSGAADGVYYYVLTRNGYEPITGYVTKVGGSAN